MNKPYPLWRIIQEEIPRADKTKFISYSVQVKIDDMANWYELYSTISEPRSKIALNRLQEIFDVYIYKWLVNSYDIPTMFEIHDQIYKTTDVLIGQSCICGSTIERNNRYGEFFIGSNKFSYIDDIVFFYSRGECLVKCNQLFLDGKLLYDSKSLYELCNEIGQDFNKLDLYPEKLIEYLRENYDGVKGYTCNSLSCFNLERKD